MTYETEDGVLTPAAIKAEVRIWLWPVSEREMRLFLMVAEAQHQADIEKVKAIENPYEHRPGLHSEDAEWEGFEKCRQAILKALGGERREKLPTPSEVRGMSPDFTGEMTTEDYLRKLRGGEK